MGCDIHAMAEIRHDYPAYTPDIWVDGKRQPGEPVEARSTWYAIRDQVFTAPYFNDKLPVSVQNVPYTSVPYSGRNYDLFAVLADVRNGRGFAGVRTGERITPILEHFGEKHVETEGEHVYETWTRGVPEDASKRWKKYVKRWGMDLHSTSWLTLEELERGPWDQRQIKAGYVDAAQYEAIRQSGFTTTPDNWSEDVGGGGITNYTADDWEALGEPARRAAVESDKEGGWFATHYVYHQWEVSLADSIGWFLEHTIPELTRNAPRVGRLDDKEIWQQLHRGEIEDPRPIDKTAIRIVFGFDN